MPASVLTTYVVAAALLALAAVLGLIAAGLLAMVCALAEGLVRRTRWGRRDPSRW